MMRISIRAMEPFSVRSRSNGKVFLEHNFEIEALSNGNIAAGQVY